MTRYRLVIAAVCLQFTLMACASGSATRTSASAPSASTTARPAVTPRPEVEVTANSLNVRQSPTSTAPVVGSLKRGQRVHAPNETENGWVYIEADDGVTGYVSARFVTDVAVPSSAPAAASQPAKQAAEPAAPRPAAGSKLAQITPGMSSEKVREIMGAPDSENAYVTGKAFIPYYYGGDTSRTDWSYHGQGVVVFSRNRYSGQLKVVEVRGIQ